MTPDVGGEHLTLPTIREGWGTSVREALQDSYPEPGALIDGAYRILEPLGEGGMGVVLKARDERLDRLVALELIHPDQVCRPKARARFLEEARAMARVAHPNVVEIHAFGELEGAPYFVMEYVPGTDLERWLAQRGSRPSLGEAWTILDQACAGAQAIHDSGTAHRDLKASNLLIGPDFRVLIADLGLARLVEEHSGEAIVSGTPAYMAPELILGRAIPPELVPRVDVYSLGVLAFELFTGSLPFAASTLSETLRLQVKAPPPRLITRRQDLPRAFEDAVLQALAKDPKERTATVDELRDALAAAWEASRDETGSPFVLIVDDEPGYRSLLTKLLTRAFPTARVEAVPDGTRGLALARSHPPDLVLSDLDMPGMNGIELTAELRAHEATREVPILVATGVGGPRDWQVLSQLGADGFVIKPFDPLQLIGMSESLLARRAAWRPPPRSQRS